MRQSTTIAATVGAALLFVTAACGSSPSASQSAASQACLDALDKAETMMTLSKTGFDYAAEAMGASGDGFTAASQLDTAGMEDARLRMDGAAQKLNALAPTVTTAAQAYNEAAAQCRAGS